VSSRRIEVDRSNISPMPADGTSQTFVVVRLRDAIGNTSQWQDVTPRAPAAVAGRSLRRPASSTVDNGAACSR
jgi:hypothetical protein